MLAGVGTTWYTWLEQGRDVQPSVEVLSALAEALKLDRSEQYHLFMLHNRPDPERRLVREERVSGSLRRMLDSLTGQPALVLGRRWDILAWNRAAEAVYGSYNRLEGVERNALHLLFADVEHRRLLVDWDTVARASLAMFRVDYGRHVGDPDFEHLIACLAGISPVFSEWWPRREVAQPLLGRKRIDHPVAGLMLFEYSSFGVDDQLDMKLIVFTPLADCNTIVKLASLVRQEF